MHFENCEEIVLASSAKLVIDRYLELSRNIISEYIANCDELSFIQCKKLLSAKYRTRSQNTANAFFEYTLEATFILLERIFLESQPFFPELLLGVCSGSREFLITQGVILKGELSLAQRFIIYQRRGRYFIYLFERSPRYVTPQDELGLFFGGNKLLNLSNGQRFNYFRRLSKKQHRQYKCFKDPVLAYHQQICQQIKALEPKSLVLTTNNEVKGAYLAEQLQLKGLLQKVLAQELSVDN